MIDKQLLTRVCLVFISIATHTSFANTVDTTELGGDTTVFYQSSDAFAKPAANLPLEKMRDFTFGNRLFNTNWIAAPASVTIFDGLGPTFNRVSCSGCHFKDGRGRPPIDSEDQMLSMLIRLSVPGKAADGGPKAHPLYGGQLNDKAIPGVAAEGKVHIEYQLIDKTYPDGTPYQLRKPIYHFAELNYGPLGDDALFSPRVAPAVHGLGLIEAIPEAVIHSMADPDDTNNDGISGRVNKVWDSINKQASIGRFGWKANQPNLTQQSAGAALGDIGITTSLNPKENCTDVQTNCQKAIKGGTPELSDEFLDKLVFYMQHLAVPARRNVQDPKVKQGEALFAEIGCQSCHQINLKTGDIKDLPALSNQIIHPYSDILLHDMGPELADNRPDYDASGAEWRTPPLWGLGLVKTVNNHSFLLHDGRARNIEEAILWHGGEAQKSNEQFQSLSKSERESLLAFLASL